MRFCTVKNFCHTLLLLQILFYQGTVVAADDAVRSTIQNSLKIFTNLQAFGKTSIVAIDCHPSLNGNQTPFSIFAADYDDTQSTAAGKFSNKLKISNNTATSTTFSLLPTDGVFVGVNALDFHIDTFNATTTDPGTVINQYAVAVREAPLFATDGNTVLISDQGAIQPVNGQSNDLVK